MEMMDVYDRDRLKTGRVLPRGAAWGAGEYRLVVHAYLFAPDGRLLIQRRQFSKKKWPGLWDVSVGGCAAAGETSREAISREVREELGLPLDFSGARPVLTVNFAGGFDDAYLAELPLDPEKLTLQAEEVLAARYAALDEILDLIARGEFVPYRPGLIRLLFEARAQRSFALVRG